jgi:hypothetical protein
VYSNIDTFELTSEDKVKLKEALNDLKKQEDDVLEVWKKIKKQNDEDLKKMEEILSKVTKRIPETRATYFDVKYFYEKPSKEVLDKLEPKMLDEYDHLDTRTEAQVKKISKTDLFKTMNLEKIKDFLKDLFKTKITVTRDQLHNVESLNFKHKGRLYKVFLTETIFVKSWIDFKTSLKDEDDVLDQIEEILKTIRSREKVKTHYDIFKDLKFTEIINKYDLKVDKKKEGTFILRINERSGERITLSDTGRLRYYRDKYDEYARLLMTLTRSDEENFTKKMYYEFLDKIDSFLTKQKKNKEKTK